MPVNLSYAHKNKLLLAGAGIFLILCWFLAFEKTFEAIRLKRSLTRSSEDMNTLASNPAVLERKARNLNLLLDRYEVDSLDWKNEFWLKVSPAAASRGLDVIYEPEGDELPDNDSTAALVQSIRFRGEFKPLVLLLDSLEKTAGIGKIIKVQFEREKETGLAKSSGKVILATDFKAVPK